MPRQRPNSGRKTPPETIPAPNSVRQSDAIALLNTLPNRYVDLILTDIPYEHVNKRSGAVRRSDKGEANELNFNPLEFAHHTLRVTRGSAIIFCGKEQFSLLYEHFDRQGFTTRMIVWEKTNPSPMNGRRIFLSGIECAVHFRKPGATFNGHCRNTVFRFPNGSSRRHPTEKPLGLFRELIELLTNPGDLVCDLCAGAGTTAVACQQLSRRWIGGDINPEYVQITNHRLQNGRSNP